ncbi:MAG: ComF family protein [Sphingomonadales bacterium]|nr:ComF family protein [Sphingomonadales bacterium]
MGFSQAFEGLVDLVFPPRCPSCGAGVLQHGRLCADCWTGLVIPGKPACKLCQRPFPFELPEGAICAPCMADLPRHNGIAAATLYNPSSRALVLAFKHQRRIALAPLLAGLIVPHLPPLDSHWLLVPVPLHRWRLWKRGYNQSALLAHALAGRTGATVVVDGLIRRRHTPSLAGKGRVARARIMAGVIAANPARRARLKGASVVLVDDVLTSGATSNACIAALKRAGARRVVIACVARVLDEAQPHASLPHI